MRPVAVWPAAILLAACALFPVPAEAGTGPSGAAEGDLAALAAEVRLLGLGEEDFVLGKVLTGEQMATAGAALAGAYPGTVKLPFGDLVVVAEEDSHLVLAVYRQNEEARAGDVRAMVGHLMGRFGEPTTMAHGNLIYWAWGRGGRIDGADYQAAKGTGALDVLATVKFSSSLPVTPGLEDEDTEETGAIYYIITSDRLLERFVAAP